MNTISPKVSAGAGAAGASAPLSTILIWLIGLLGVVIPPEVAAAMAGLIAAIVGLVAGYMVPHEVAPAVVVPVPVLDAPKIIVPPGAV